MASLNVQIHYAMPSTHAGKFDTQVEAAEQAIESLQRHVQQQDDKANHAAQHLFFSTLRDLVANLYAAGQSLTADRQSGDIEVTFTFSNHDSDGSALGDGAGSTGAASTGGSPIGAVAEGSSSEEVLLPATKQMQETQMSFNLQYLQLQSQMQHENRSYTMVSNIMKTKHDTVKNSISNIR